MKLKILKLITILILLVSGTCFAQYEKIQNRGVDIYYRIFGEGKPILVLGGGPGDVSDRYLEVCNLLSKKYQCILVDQRGTGKSAPAIFDSTTVSIALTIDDFEAIRKKLGFEEWNILGISYGGYLASVYAHDYPSSISSIILLGSIGLNTDMFAYFNDNIVHRLHPNDIAVMEYWSDSTRLSDNYHHAVVEYIRASMPAYFFDRKKSLPVAQTIKDADFNFELGQLIFADVAKNKIDLVKKGVNFKKPVLIIHGRQDPVGESVPYILSQHYENSKLVFLEKCGHYSWVEQPEKLFSAIDSFLISNF